MVDHTLPAYLQNRVVQDFTDYASDGLGSALPPHVSIQGNLFTLVDATGQEYQPLPTMDCVIVDRSNFACKMYYGGKAYVPGSDDPPVCWSTNGVGPSRDAAQPQARSCAECPNNVRGSAVSKISGAAIKACRDEYHMAILLPSISDMMFRYVLTPGSFENWQNYTAKFKNSNVRISMVVTRIGFQPKVNGVVTFESVAYVDEATNARVEAALREKATDVLCGRLDSPKAIAGGQPAPLLAPAVAPQPTTLTIPQGSPQSQNPSGTLTIPNTVAPAGTAPTASPSDPAPAQRRRRRTQAEIAADNQAAAAGPGGSPAASQAPFPVNGQAGSPQFGIAQGAPTGADPDVAKALDSFFGT